MSTTPLRTAMPDVDFSRWPIIEVRVDAAPGPADLAAVIGAVESALERHAPFALTVITPVLLSAIGDAGTQLLPVMRRRRAEVGTWCRAVAYVLPTLTDALVRRARADELAWGCPVRAFDTRAKARTWLDHQLDSPGQQAPR